jgi:endonuclease/exonuclease/phosphatase family metal-dependent hydrolase
MNRKSMIAFAVAALASTGMAPAASDPSLPLGIAAGAALGPGRLSILTYNVEGLPWPAVSDRPANLARIGATLAALRAAGRAPQVVVLQEAFTQDAQDMARQTGYRHMAFGPASLDPQPTMPRYALPGAVLMGEGLGTPLSSGLILLSDYKLTHVRRTPFPAGACSGYDCLANKGILSARLDIPGLARPIEIVTAHFNSGHPSGQPEPVNRIAFTRQLEALGRFMDQDRRSGAIARIYAGDFNIGHSPGRLTALLGYIRKRKGIAAAALGKDKRVGLCRTAPRQCLQGVALGANVPLVHTNDWQFLTPSRDVTLFPVAREILFGRDKAGRMPSDHFGLNVIYQFR